MRFPIWNCGMAVASIAAASVTRRPSTLRVGTPSLAVISSFSETAGDVGLGTGEGAAAAAAKAGESGAEAGAAGEGVLPSALLLAFAISQSMKSAKVGAAALGRTMSAERLRCCTLAGPEGLTVFLPPLPAGGTAAADA